MTPEKLCHLVRNVYMTTRRMNQYFQSVYLPKLVTLLGKAPQRRTTNVIRRGDVDYRKNARLSFLFKREDDIFEFR